MNANFLETVLPTQGIYCAVGIGNGTTVQRFAETLDSLKEQANKLIERKLNVYFALGTFEGHTRKATECVYMRAFFIDLDCGENKHYVTKKDALLGLMSWLEKTKVKKPILVDSGGGIHAYWPFTEDIPADKWKPYAEKFKSLCLDNGLHIDTTVTADAARVMRYPGSYNYRRESLCEIKTGIVEYAFDEFVELLGPIREATNPAVIPNVKDGSLSTINKTDNHEYDWEKIKSGCAQLAKASTEQATCSYKVWFGALSVAVRCIDGDRIIHEISKEHPEYSYEKTEKVANSSFGVPGSHRCATFNQDSPGICENCPRFGVINSPISIGSTKRMAESLEGNLRFEEAGTGEQDSVRNKQGSKEVPLFPEYLTPYMRGANGGIFYQPAPDYDKKTKKPIFHDPICLLTEDLYAIKRMYSQQDGEILQLRLHTPQDGIRDFLIAMKHVYAMEKFKEQMSVHGVFINPKYIPELMNYVIRWGKYLLNTERAEVLRIQMGWSDDMKSFVAGRQEITLDEIFDCPPSPMSKSLALQIKPEGEFSVWQESANKLNVKSLEVHAFTMLCGFGSTLMPHAINAGSAVVLHGQMSGVGKTGALYAAMSAWGNPKEMSVMEDTENAFTARVVNLKNLPMGLDEQSNTDGKTMSQRAYILNNGKPKIRMMSSVNAERMVPMSAALIAIFTSNANLIDTIKEYRSTPHGEAARILSFHMNEKPAALQGRGQEIGAEIFHPFNYNYGHAGPMFIQEVLKAGQATVKIYIEHWERKFREDFSQNSEYRFYTATVAAAFAAGEILNKAGIVSLDLDRIYWAILTKLKNELDEDTINETDYETILGGYVNNNINNILVLGEGGKLITAPRNQLLIRIDTSVSMMYVSKPEFKDYLRKQKIQFKDFENSMVKLNKLVDRQKKIRLGAGWQPGADGVYAYAFTTDISKFVEDALSSNRESAA